MELGRGREPAKKGSIAVTYLLFGGHIRKTERPIKKTTAPERLTSPHFAREEFAGFPPLKAPHDGRSKILRWFKNEQPTDHLILFVASPDDETFYLRFIPKGLPPNVPTTGRIGVSPGQDIVNKIEMATASFSNGAFEFVLFEDSPQAEALFRSNN